VITHDIKSTENELFILTVYINMRVYSQWVVERYQIPSKLSEVKNKINSDLVSNTLQ